MITRIRQLAYGVGGVALNLTLFGQALKSNERNNAHLASLSQEERIKLAARHTYLRAHSTTYSGSGGIGDKLAEASYDQLPENVKQRHEAKEYFRKGL